MLHAADYSNMKLRQMNKKVDNSKKNDDALRKSIQ